jgi:phage-related protein
MKKFEILLSDEVNSFLDEIAEKDRDKILFNIKKAQELNDPRLFKKLKGSEIWEFRTKYAKKEYRLLAFWDKRKPEATIVICALGFIKKTSKTPSGLIDQTEQIRQEYFANH